MTRSNIDIVKHRLVQMYHGGQIECTDQAVIAVENICDDLDLNVALDPGDEGIPLGVWRDVLLNDGNSIVGIVPRSCETVERK